MREIKFRGETKYNEKKHKKEEWIFGDLRLNNKEQAFITERDILETEIIPETIGQYTGLKDKNGKEIYEGDIVAEYGHYINSDKVVYQEIQWKENYSCWLRGDYQRLTPKNIERYKIVVVGNIYENSNLLND